MPTGVFSLLNTVRGKESPTLLESGVSGFS